MTHGFPIRCLTKEYLSPPESEVVSFLIMLHDAFERGIRSVGISRTEKHQVGEHARKSSISVLERMNREEHHVEDRDAYERMKDRLLPWYSNLEGTPSAGMF